MDLVSSGFDKLNMTIASLADLEKLESQIASAFRKLKLGDVLHSLYLLKKNPQSLDILWLLVLLYLQPGFVLPAKHLS